jgi:hypothetical protein
MGIDFDLSGIDMTIRGLDRAALSVREGAYQGVLEALNRAYVACYHLLSEQDHSLIALAKLGHPYGFTHPQVIEDPDVTIHVQSGEYRAALRKVSPAGRRGDIIGGKIVNDSPLDRWLQDGTTKMRGRPYMRWIVENFGDDMAELIRERALAGLRNLRPTG